jgi:PQQ-dependent catabolism-associated CXXCW motif protein
MGKSTEATADFQQALTLDPEYADAKAALDKAAAALKPAATTDTAASVDDKNSALSALNGTCANCGKQPDNPTPGSSSLPPLAAPGASGKTSERMDFIPTLPGTTGNEPDSDSVQPQASWPATTVAAKNYADETTDWGVKQQTVLKKDVGKKTPMFLPGARRITTPELLEVGPQSLLIDVLDDTDHHITLPGAVHMPGAGNYGGGRFNDKLQKKFAKALAGVTNDNLDRQLVFFCYGAECWESYNAALRAINMGFHNVLWYRGGLESWKDAELPLAPPAVTVEVR